MTAAVTAGGENESMGGIDLVTSSQRCETECTTQSWVRRGETGGRRGEVCANDDERWGRMESQLT